MKTLCILTNGGDTCALNASIKSIRDSAYLAGYKKIYGAKRGYQGLIDGSLEDITRREIDVRIGGSCLGSMRTGPTMKVENGFVIDSDNCEAMARTLNDYRIDVLVVIGGDGTLQATKHFQDWVFEHKARLGLGHFNILGFLKTIDNDVRTYTFFKGIQVALTPGFPSAVKKIVATVEDLRVTSRTAERAFAVEMMGRDAGWLAASGTFGGAEVVVFPELLKRYRMTYPEISILEFSNTVWENIAELVARFYRQNRNVIIAVAEGFEPPQTTEVGKFAEFAKVVRGLYGPRKKVGATEFVTMTLSDSLNAYFSCLTELSKFAATEEIAAANLSRLVKEYRPDLEEGHPLENWKMDEFLARELGIDLKKMHDKEETRETLKRKTSAAGPAASASASDKGIPTWRSNCLLLPPYRFEIRPHRTDYVPRSGPPSPYDYKLATVLGRKIGSLLEEDKFGVVPCLSEVVKYENLNLDVVKTENITEIRTLAFDKEDYFDIETFKVSDKITDFFRTIMTGPDDLETAISELE